MGPKPKRWFWSYTSTHKKSVQTWTVWIHLPKQYCQVCFITQLQTLCIERDPIRPHYFAFMTKICIVATIRQTWCVNILYSKSYLCKNHNMQCIANIGVKISMKWYFYFPISFKSIEFNQIKFHYSQSHLPQGVHKTLCLTLTLSSITLL